MSAEAKAYKDAVYYSTRTVEPFSGDPCYCVEVTVFQGKGDKGDVDNYAKCVLDGMTAAGVIRSDAMITDLILRKRRDWKQPRTEIAVKAFDMK